MSSYPRLWFRLRGITLCWLLAGSGLAVALAEDPDGALRFQPIAGESGLSDDWVRCVLQDERDFIWIGTADGLNRYDGVSMAVFRPVAATGEEMAGVAINALARKRAGQLWVGTDRGLFVFDQAADRFDAVEALGQIPSMAIWGNEDGSAWIGTNNGLHALDADGEASARYSADPDDGASLVDGFVNALFRDRENRLWIGTKGGLSRFIPATNSFEGFRPDPSDPDSMADADVQSIAQDRWGRIWIASARGGVEVLEESENAPPRFRMVAPGKSIRIWIDRRDWLWIAFGSGGGLATIDLDGASYPDASDLRFWRHDPLDSRSLSDDSVFTLFEDRWGDMWIGTFGRGLSYFSPRAKPFRVVNAYSSSPRQLENDLVNAFFEEDRYWWVGTEAGLERFDKQGGSKRRYAFESGNPASLVGEAVFAIHKDTGDRLWVGTWSGGLNRYDYGSESFRRYMPDGTEDSISSPHVYSIVEDSRGHLWVGTIGGGVCRFDPNDETFEIFRHRADDPASLSSDFVTQLLVARDGALYVATARSLDVFDPSSGGFRRHTLERGDSNALFEDSQGQVWVATSSGLECFDKASGRFRFYGAQDGLPPHGVVALQEDAAGNLWLASSRGLSVFENAVFGPESPVIREIGQEEGLSEGTFKKRASYRDAEDQLYFGSSRGYTVFRPESIRLNDTPPEVVFTEFLQLESAPGEQAGFRTVHRNLDWLDTVELRYPNADFIVRFASMNFLHPERNRYRYQLEGYDQQWVDAGDARSATYTNIPPGRYVLRVEGSNNDGVWSIEPRELAIMVHPAWWGTLYFKIAAWSLVAALIVIAYQLRFAMLRRQRKRLQWEVEQRTRELTDANELLSQKQEEIAQQNSELAEHRDHLEGLVSARTRELEAAKVRAEESDRLKSSFLANMSHEIRTPMNAIIGFSSLLRSRNLSEEEQHDYLNIIGSNGNALIVLIDDILDVSLIDSGLLSLDRVLFDACSILREIREHYELESRKPIEIEFDGIDRKGDPLMLYNDPVRFRQVVNNLLSNAYKYTDHGSIRVVYRVAESEVVFSVVDTGIGIRPDDQDKVFEPFYKVERDRDRLFAGTGIGLAICRKLVGLMGGRVWLESGLGQGSTFHFALPYERTQSGSAEPKRESQPCDLTGLTVLVAEDEPTNFKLAWDCLRGTGAVVTHVENGIDAVDFVRERVDEDRLVVLMDIKMPRMDGYEACSLIKELRPRTPVVAVTAYAQASDRRRIDAHGFDGYLAKPFERDELVAALVRAAR